MTEDKCDPLVESARMTAFNAAIEAKMAAFNNHKQLVLTILRDAYDGGPKAEPFDGEKLWLRLETTAHQFFLNETAKQAKGRANREARLRAIEKVLRTSRTLVDEAMLDEVGDDLFSAWSDKVNLPLTSVTRNDDGSLVMAHPADEMFKKTLAGLRDLETAAGRAAEEAHSGRGRPPGARVLPLGYIEVLADQYLTSTGARPDPSRGPFVNFVYAFLVALGRANITEDYVVKLVRDARSWATTHPNEWAPSLFSE